MAGLAIGDALGRPVEGMSYQDIRAKYGAIDDFVNLEPEVAMTLSTPF